MRPGVIARKVVFALACISLLLGSLAPLRGQAQSLAQGLIEVCTGYGTKWVDINQSASDDSSNAPPDPKMLRGQTAAADVS